MNKICIELEVLYKMSVIVTTERGWVVVFYICFHCDFVFFHSFCLCSCWLLNRSLKSEGRLSSWWRDTSRESCHCCAEIRGGGRELHPRGWCNPLAGCIPPQICLLWFQALISTPSFSRITKFTAKETSGRNPKPCSVASHREGALDDLEHARAPLQPYRRPTDWLKF